MTLVAVVAAIAVLALVMAVPLPQPGPRRGRGHREHADDRPGGAGGRVGLPEPPVPYPAAGSSSPVFAPAFLLPGDAGSVIGPQRLLRRRRACSPPSIGYLGMWLAVRANVRVAAAARDGRRDDGMRIAFRTGGTVGMATVGLGLLGASVVVLHLQGRRALGARGLRLRRGAARDVHAGRRRHLHQGRGRRRGPRRQGRAGHPRGRPAQRRHDRRQRRRQRRRLRRHGRRPVRVVRGDPGRRAHPGQGRLRRPGPGLPAHRPRHRRAHRRRSGSSSPGRGAGENGLVAINRGFYICAVDLGGALRGRRVRVPAVARSPSLTGADISPCSVSTRDPRSWSRSAPCSSASCWPASSCGLPATSPAPTRSRPCRVARTSLTGPATVILSGIGVGLESAVYTASIIAAAVYCAFLLGGGSIILAAVPHRPRGLRPAHHRRRHRRDGHLRPGQRQRPGHRRDVR